MKTELFENALQTGGIWRHQLCVLMWTETFWIRRFSKADDVLIILWLTVTLKGALKLFCCQWLLRFQISSAWCGRKTNDAFSEGKRLRPRAHYTRERARGIESFFVLGIEMRSKQKESEENSRQSDLCLQNAGDQTVVFITYIVTYNVHRNYEYKRKAVVFVVTYVL